MHYLQSIKNHFRQIICHDKELVLYEQMGGKGEITWWMVGISFKGNAEYKVMHYELLMKHKIYLVMKNNIWK